MRAGSLALALVLAASAACQAPPPASSRRSDVALPRETNVIEAVVPVNATLETLLQKNDLPATIVAGLVTSIRSVFNPRGLRAHQAYRITRTLDGLLREFEYEIDADRFLRAVLRRESPPDSPAFDVSVEERVKTVTNAAISTTISREHPSIIGAFDAVGEQVQLALVLSTIFGGEVDFNSDLQAGDRIDVLFERIQRDGADAGYGDVEAAVLETGGRTLTAVRYVGPDGKPGYYDQQGRSLKRQFLASPLPFEPRVTSRFSYRRVNPVHGGVRPHLGVDYGAPAGTAVKAVAAGVVDFANWNGEAGRMVRIRHSGGYQTSYLHLSSFAAGIRPGARVDQGDIIGRVGMTGTATGPHLDYRISKNGVYLNPLAALSRMPAGEPIPASDLEAFGRARDTVMAELRTLVADAAAATAVVRKP
jgi:murein DD-endopeptidase MepM/ murein hydrolase activator NlpD